MPSLSFGRNLAKTSRTRSETIWKIGEIEKGRKLKNGQTAEDGRSKWAALCTTSSSHPLDTFSTVWHWTQVYWNKQPTWRKKRISPSTSGCSAYCYCITNSLSIVPAPVFSWNVSFKNAHFVRKEENTLFSYLRIPPESRPPSSSKKTYADGLPEKSLSLIRNSKSNLVLGISLI